MNIRSMNKNFKHLESIIQKNATLVDVIILTEINLKDHQCSLFNLKNYEMYAVTRDRQSGGGVMMYLKNNHQFIPNDYHSDYYENISGEIHHNGQRTQISAIYKPPKTDKLCFIKDLKHFISICNNKNILICGDTNIDTHIHNTYSEMYLNTLSQLGFTQCITKYTRVEISGNNLCQSCIDHILVRGDASALCSAVISHKISDHYPVVLATYRNIQDVKQTTREVLNNKLVFEKILKVEWDALCTIECSNELYENIYKQFDYIYSTSKVQRIITIRQQKTHTWVTTYIQKQIRKRDDAYKVWLNNKQDMHAKVNYNKIRNRANKIIQKAKSNYHKSDLNRVKGNTRVLWGKINDFLGKKSVGVDGTLVKYFKNDVNTDYDIANIFSRKFSTAVSKEPICDKNLITNSMPQDECNRSLRFRKATSNDVIKIIDELDDRKSPGFDNIRASDLKLIKHKIATTIAHLINISVKNGIMPDKTKISIIRPIFKGGDHREPDNYRPIAILSVIDKIIERFVNNQIVNFYEVNNIYNDTQYGFRKKRSTVQLLSKMTDKINNHRNNRHHVVIIFIDFSKAFDTLKHDILIQKLEKSGIRGPLLQWFRNYLENRKLTVKVNQSYSDMLPIEIGTVQGSILGPTTFLTYANSMTLVILMCLLLQFADDAAIVAANKDIKTAETQLQKDFDNICKWAHDLGLIINTKKTRLMHIHSSHIHTHHRLRIQAHSHECLHNNESNDNKTCACPQLDVTESHTYIGLRANGKFNWSTHVDYVCQKLRIILSKMFELKLKLPFPVLLLIYKALADSIISYGLSSYGRTYNSYINKIYNLQIKILKQIVPPNIKQKYKHNDNAIFKYCDVLPIQKKVKLSLILENHEGNDLKIPLLHNVQTRQKQKGYLQEWPAINAYGERTLKYMLPKLINELPYEIKNETNINNLKKKLKQYYIDH